MSIDWVPPAAAVATRWAFCLAQAASSRAAATASAAPARKRRSLPEVHSERPVYDHRRGLAQPETGAHTDPQTKPERG
jgi:hypothetical protein